MPRSILPTPRGPSAYWYNDPEGAPNASGARFHAALDWFAAGDTAVRAPDRGHVVEVRPSRGRSGQVFGGVVKVRTPQGRVYVMRHVEPAQATKVGLDVHPSQLLATVTRWTDGPPHVHLEVWRQLHVPGRPSGYWQPNMLDPGSLPWTPYLAAPALPPDPEPPDGATLRLVVGERSWSGWPECDGPLRWVAAHGVDPDQPRAALAWRGRVHRGPKDVTNVARNLVSRFLSPG